MNYQFTIFSGLLLLAAIAAFGIFFLLWRRRESAGARYLAFFELSVAFWALGATLEAAATSLPIKMFWTQASYVGIVSCPVFFFLFAMSYAQVGVFLTSRNIMMLFVCPALTVLTAWTSFWHHWLWTGITIDPATNMAVYSHGPYYWVFVGYSYLLCASAVVTLVLSISSFPKEFRSQNWIIFTGAVFPLVGNAAYITGVNPVPDFDWTPFAFLLSGLICTIGLYWFRLFELAPIARSRLVDTMGDAVLVIDASGRIVDINYAMKAAMEMENDNVIGLPAAHVFRHWDACEDCLNAETEMSSETQLYTDEGKRYYDLKLSLLRNGDGELSGRLIVLRDITTRKILEEEKALLIEELQDALKKVKMLSGLLPICAGCKRIKDDAGSWQNVEEYVTLHSEVEFSHGLCPDCIRKYYPDLILESKG